VDVPFTMHWGVGHTLAACAGHQLA
jgi:hypothetical protein